mmetsp:Transcript_6953/g.13894  ORF Transcript_6953/g.13894 Transcript_6953/m.13894 type:complete len:338 (+) Transcript_6953:91-1104(+)
MTSLTSPPEQLSESASVLETATTGSAPMSDAVASEPPAAAAPKENSAEADTVEVKASTPGNTSRVEQEVIAPESSCADGTTTLGRKAALERVSPSNAPEGHLLGNFHKYYEFNPPAARLRELPDEFWQGIVAKAGGTTAHLRILDIGCNDGTLTKLFREALLTRGGAQHVKAVGVDIDAALIARGQEALDISEVELIADDVAAYDHDPEVLHKSYDLVTCFGVTMWVHLNYGDEGLIRLLQRIGKCTRGSLVIEPQLWKSYRNAKRRLRRAGATVPASFLEIGIGSQVELDAFIEEELSKWFPSYHKLGTTENWGRNVWEYVKDPLIAATECDEENR